MDAGDDLARGSGAFAALDRAQRRFTVVAFPLAVVRRFRDDGGRGLAAVIAYYTFSSIFPLLLTLVTVLGFLLEDDEELRRDVIDSALGQFPVIGDTLRGSGGLEGNLFGLIVGLLVAVWAGLRALAAAAHAFNEVWAVPIDSRHRFLESRLRALVVLAGLAAGLVLTVTVNLMAAVAPGSLLAQAGLWSGGIAVTVSLVLASYVVLTARPLPVRRHLRGALLAGIGIFGLQLSGAILLDRVIANASTTYGTFAFVIGVLTWLSAIANVLVLGAEVNVVLEHRLWPRGLRRRFVTDADLRARQLEQLSRTPSHLR